MVTLHCKQDRVTVWAASYEFFASRGNQETVNGNGYLRRLRRWKTIRISRGLSIIEPSWTPHGKQVFRGRMVANSTPLLISLKPRSKRCRCPEYFCRCRQATVVGRGRRESSAPPQNGEPRSCLPSLSPMETAVAAPSSEDAPPRGHLPAHDRNRAPAGLWV